MKESNVLRRITRDGSRSLAPKEIAANQNNQVNFTQEEIRFKIFSLINIKNLCNKM
jgi:hypothetical protein